MLDPTVGIWMTEDPIGFDAGDPNLRRYVGNNATNSRDPSGLAEKPTLNELKDRRVALSDDLHAARAALESGFRLQDNRDRCVERIA